MGLVPSSEVHGKSDVEESGEREEVEELNPQLLYRVLGGSIGVRPVVNDQRVISITSENHVENLDQTVAKEDAIHPNHFVKSFPHSEHSEKLGEEGGSDGRKNAVLFQHVGILPPVSAQASCFCGFIERVGRARGIVILFPEEELNSDGGNDVEQRARQVS